MPWSQTVFERDTIYAEVWAEPVNAVAKRYGVSDVALRKICTKLGVPVPPLGHWAKLAAGQKPPVPKLPTNHKGPTQHARQHWIDPDETERRARTTLLLQREPSPVLATPALKSAVADCHPAVRRTGKQLKQLQHYGRGLLHAQGMDVFPMSVSVGNKDRALLVLDAVLDAARQAGGELESSDKTGNRLMLRLRGEFFRLCIRESSERTERDLTREELEKKKEGKLYYIPDSYAFAPSGKLRLEVREDDRYSPLLTLTDGSAQIETRLDRLVPTLLEKAAENRVRREMRDEDHRRWEAARERREALEACRDNELARLKQIEEWVAQWKRANELRAFTATLEALAQAGEKFNIDPVWVRNAADWLDPLTAKHWPAVDIDEPDDAVSDEEDESDDESEDDPALIADEVR